MSEEAEPEVVPDYPRPSKADTALTGLRALVSIFSGPAAELMSLLGSPVERRREAWAQNVVDACNEARERGVDVEALKDNEAFISLVLTTTQIGLRNHEKEKLEALRNAILNVAIGLGPDETLQGLFLVLVDRFTVLHLKLLKVLADPVGWCRANEIEPSKGGGGESMSAVLKAAFPNADPMNLLLRVSKDLFDEGLSPVINLEAVLNDPSGLPAPRKTEFGERFLAFIEEPPESP